MSRHADRTRHGRHLEQLQQTAQRVERDMPELDLRDLDVLARTIQQLEVLLLLRASELVT